MTTEDFSSFSFANASLAEVLRKVLSCLPLPIEEEKIDALVRFGEKVVQANRFFNLTSLTTPVEMAIKNFLDSLMVLNFVPFPPRSRVVDVGTGAGFPGLALKIVRPDLRLTLIESQQKKARFLQETVRELKLMEIEVVAQRAEEAGRNPSYREQFDYALSRAVASLPVLVEYLLPLVRVGGVAIAYKGPRVEEELRSARGIHLLGGGDTEVLFYRLPHVNASRSLVLIKKLKETPPLYPRRPGRPAKEPL